MTLSTRSVRALGALASVLVSVTALAVPVRYELDPGHTYPSFEADHMGLSIWRGKFNRSSGTVELDRAAGTGTVEVTIDTTSIDFGHDEMNRHARAADIFDTDRYPTATYKGRLTDFRNGMPRTVRGELTLHGVTKPVKLDVVSFRCVPEHPINKRETCGADLRATFNRGDFGINFGLDMGMKPTVQLRIQAEAIRQD